MWSTGTHKLVPFFLFFFSTMKDLPKDVEGVDPQHAFDKAGSPLVVDGGVWCQDIIFGPRRVKKIGFNLSELRRSFL